MRNAYKALVGKRQGGRPKPIWSVSNKTELKEIIYEEVD
jgi:hypothetical protein